MPSGADPGDRRELERIVSLATDERSYGGLAADPDSGAVTVYVTAAAYKTLKQALRTAHLDAVTVVEVDRSYDDLMRLADQITNGRATLAAEGIDLHSWGPDVRANDVAVRVWGDPRRAQSHMDAEYGVGAVSVRKVALNQSFRRLPGSETSCHRESGIWTPAQQG